MENLNNYREWLLAEYGNKNTAKSYYYTIKRFLDNNELTEQSIVKYASELIEKSKSTQNQFIKAIKSYSKFMKQEVDVPKYKIVDKKIHQYITEQELLNDFIPMMSLLFVNHFRLEVMFKFLFYTGLRREELINLKREDIDLKELTVTIRNTKGKEDRNVHFPPQIVSELRSLFNLENENQNAFNIGTYQLDNYMMKINKQKIMDKKFHPHLFRHSCAKHLLREGVDVSVVQKILGHKDIETTLLYVDPDEKMVKEMYHKFIDKKGK